MPGIADVVTALFVPGDRPDRFAKAAASGADLVIVDLEDAVGDGDKAAAREHVRSALIGSPPLGAAVRIDGTSPADLELVTGIAESPGHGLLAVVVPKAADPDALSRIARSVPGIPLIALVESARGLANARALAEVAGVERFALGALDLAVDLGVGADPGSPAAREALLIARSTLVLESRLAGLGAPIDSPATDFRDPLVAEEDARYAAGLGFGGKLCIHPAQVPAVRRGFAPTPAQRAWALRVLGAPDAEAAAFQLDGHMVDLPVVLRARRILAHPEAQPEAPAAD
ncbi:CoA ester lyase [Herbiconiux sp. CPCC 203407]|uniref:CoA ester lyase n=1 Tax=Herbiconiux oxytropis TaxID=2970915 RepID=A0AA41XIT3_9MICO|nr:CoA ester lyase [Herbiconiux oxytropis]MCS5723334.1 CoA ester lyase [Herbiconiux oxytropis]MCS5727513.1 CoA ester lyase [Herbiconiux oxytropis]